MSPLRIKNLNLKNRIVVSPMCQYSSENGFVNDWHLVHLGSRAAGGAGLVFTEATAVTPQGRISPSDLGLWDDNHIEPLSRIAAFIHRMGSIAGIQLAHAGRKGSCDVPWKGGASLKPTEGGWNIIGPSAIPFSDSSQTPKALNHHGIKEVIQAFKIAAERSVKAGFKIIEIHSAHGYLLHQFLSPLSNLRTDEYGGNLENRMRLLCQVVSEVKAITPKEMPLFVRISATDWVDGGWDLEQSIILASKLKTLGVDLIDVSSGGTVPKAKIPIGPNYQVPFAAEIRQLADIKTGAVGLITESHQANDIIISGKADLVFVGREFLRKPYWGLTASSELSQEPDWPIPYGYAIQRHH
ncbi:MAG: NADH:flavin oxidoreductase/NADH oxidase [Parachlamydiaceae bacterium]|nr:NADH:flavin oxidoreductase/NADH oxidase [Parachlamydiaceae bacterium]